MVGVHLIDDLGIWDNYGQIQRDFIKTYHDGTIKAKLGESEFKSYSWDKYEKSDPSFLFELIPRIARKEGELATVFGAGTGALFDKWGLSEEDWKKDKDLSYWKMAHPKHHSNEEAYQLGAIINTQYNRDVQCHTHTNFLRNGLPIKEQKRLAKDLWGSEDAVDDIGRYTPMNINKAKMTRWTLLRKKLHDSLSLCNWMAPVVASPLKERGYSGDDTLESLLYSLATGEKVSREELDGIGDRIFCLHRALTIRDMGTKEMRREHDTFPEWVFKDPQNRLPSPPGQRTWKKTTSISGWTCFTISSGGTRPPGPRQKRPTKKLKLGYVAEEFKKKGLLP